MLASIFEFILLDIFCAACYLIGVIVCAYADNLRLCISAYQKRTGQYLIALVLYDRVAFACYKALIYLAVALYRYAVRADLSACRQNHYIVKNNILYGYSLYFAVSQHISFRRRNKSQLVDGSF